ncbi:MAG TPA: 2-amino-4-hydroxy-6-hydroxymethyldihydropteridine diphosphokinase, partial [Cryomorphaceae bacterium]|nr:2-amino-4-hydroxy-6-hydroxymethyldihydropteridine diphosphokinase [Cryomorphaceae bacterium]
MKEEKSVRTVYLGLGCNLGNRLESLDKAIVRLGRLGEVTAKSKVYESPPWGYDDDRSYLNMCCALRTDLSIEALHEATLDIEVALGRETNKRKTGEPYKAR